MEAFVNEVLMAYGDWRFLIMTAMMLIVGLVFLKGYKKRFVIPALILAAVILNPLFYILWYKFNDRSYWRMMWMVPIIPVCVIVPAFFIEKCKKDIVKVGVLGLTTVVIILCGSFIYDGGREVFAAANNPEKLPDDVVAVGEALLAIDDYPTAVADGSISTYIRQYSGKILTPYARSATWGYPSGIARKMYTDLVNQNMTELANKMREYDYEYLVTQNQNDEKKNAIDIAGFELLTQHNEYGVYRIPEKNNEIRTYNELHQTTSITITDIDGNPVNGEEGYSIIYYNYDENGLRNYEFRTSTDGKGVVDSYGRAGYRCVYNGNGMVVSQAYLNEEGDLVQNGLAKIISEYDNKNHLVRESYFDANDSLINIGECGYANRVNEYDSDGELLLTYFYDKDGNYVECGSSYFHEYLNSIKKQNKLIFISIKDDGALALTSTLINDLKKLGIQTDLSEKYRYSYYAVITQNETIEDISLDNELNYENEIDGVRFTISSAGLLAGNRSSILIDEIEYSKNMRGMNIVIYDLKKGRVTESIAFDTWSSDMKVTK